MRTLRAAADASAGSGKIFFQANFSNKIGVAVPEPLGLIFDCDGTLADTMPAHLEAWLETIEPLGATMTSAQFYGMGGWPTQKVAAWLIGAFPLQLDPVAISNAKECRFERRLHEILPIRPVLAIARNERGRRPLAVATGGMRRVCEAILRQIGCLDWFDAIVCCEDVGRHKPEPDIFLEAARRLNLPPQRCVAYEDTDPGLESARRAGMAVVDVRTMYEQEPAR
ncbi:MAG TPA: HAD-IA family hydrolase [Pirellulales bacterium]|jgi:HAD superfamily hydrolase (TIGR01509 family)|nr:HAD-IA family hydrolase [Pirellulales bacterium]